MNPVVKTRQCHCVARHKFVAPAFCSGVERCTDNNHNHDKDKDNNNSNLY